MSVNIPGLTALTAPASTDEIEVYDTSASQNKRMDLAYLVTTDGTGTATTGGGTIALGGYTLTVPATGTAALLGTANTFSANQRINALVGVNNAPTSGQQLTIKAGAASTVPLVVDTSASPSANTLVLKNNGTDRIEFRLQDSRNQIRLGRFDNGTGVGPAIYLQYNNNASTPAAGYYIAENLNGDPHRIWPDVSGDLRIWPGGDPTNASDTAGTVVGTQTSWHELKESVAAWDGAGALDAIRAMDLYSYQMIEDGQKTPDDSKPTYYGIVITDEDRTNNEWFGLGYADNQIPVLNTRTITGYMLAAIREGGDVINALQAEIATLTARVSALENP